MRHDGIPFDLTPVPVMKRHDCAVCGKPVTHRAWSPYWCPQHDKERVERITAQLTAIVAKSSAPAAPRE